MKVQIPWIGKAAGSSAGMIYQSYWGRTYARSFPFLFHYPDTPEQQECQAKFHDIRRIWEPIYNRLRTYISKGQRVNRNIYNEYLKAMFQIFNPYDKRKATKPINTFGLDRYNRLRVDIGQAQITITEELFYFDVSKLEIIGSTNPLSCGIHYLALNITQQNLYYIRLRYRPNLRRIEFKNSYDWTDNDKILLYVACDESSWMGNFNMMQLQ